MSDTPPESYSRQWWRQALSDATASLGFNRPTAMRLVLVLLAGVGLSRFISVDLAAIAAWQGFVNVVLAHLVVLGVVLLVYAVRAPAKIHARQVQTIIDLTERKRDRDLAERLARHDEIAVHRFWAKRPKASQQDQVDKWLSELDEWTSQLYAIMDECGCNYLEIKAVRVLGNLRPYSPSDGSLYHKHPTVNHALTMLDARRTRLGEIIEKYMSRGSLFRQ
jgi:hypothetical protein